MNNFSHSNRVSRETILDLVDNMSKSEINGGLLLVK